MLSVKILLPQLGNILPVPPFDFKIVGQCGRNGFRGKNGFGIASSEIDSEWCLSVSYRETSHATGGIVAGLRHDLFSRVKYPALAVEHVC